MSKQRLIFPALVSAFVLLGFFSPCDGALPKVVLQTLAQAAADVKNEVTTLTDGQRSLLSWYNDDINRARINGWIPDDLYQAGQNVHHNTSSGIAGRAARGQGANFTIQQSTRRTFMPGTDSDYIYELDPNSANPVDDIKNIQSGYNDGMNDYMRRSIDSDPQLRAALEAENIKFKPRTDWHRKLDVDFMADPRTVNQSQFEKIGELNNDAYTRRKAAEYERISRAKDGTRVPPDMYTAYVDEMQDFIKKKRAKIAEMRKNPNLFTDSTALADYHQAMAQEQKYIARIESTNAHLRTQEGLGVSCRPQSSADYTVRYDKNGRAVISRNADTLTQRGSSRLHGNLDTSLAGNRLGIHSENRALIELSESMAEAARRNPGKWATAAEDIARLTDHLTPAEKGHLIETIKRTSGHDVASKIAESMRKQAAPPGGIRASMGRATAQLDEALRGALGVSDDLSRMGKMRRGFNEAATKALGGMENLSRGAVAMEIAMASGSIHTWITSILKAIDPAIPDDEAEEHFKTAMEASKQLVIQGGMGTLFEAVPTTGIIFLGWTLGFDGTGYILRNTETGEEFNRRVADYFDRNKKASENAWSDLNDFLGEESDRSHEADELTDLETSLIAAIADGRVILKPGVSVKDIIDLIRKGDIIGARELIEKVDPRNPHMIIDHLQNELLSLYQLAGKVNADYESMQTDTTSARGQMTAANGQLAAIEDIARKLSKVNSDCRRVAELQAQVREDGSGAVKLEKLVRRDCEVIDMRAATVRTEEQLEQLRGAHGVVVQAAGKVGAAAKHAKSENEELRKIVTAARAAGTEYARTLTMIDKGKSVAQAGIGSCLHAAGIAPRHAERWQQLQQRKAALLGQIERMRQVFAENREAVARLSGIEQGVSGLNPGPPTATMKGQVATTRDGLDTIKESLIAVRGKLVDPEPCGQQTTEDAAVTAAEQAAMLTALRVAQTKLVLDGMQIADDDPPDVNDLTRGIRNRLPPAEVPDPEDLTRGVRNRLPPEEEVPDPVDLTGGTRNRDPRPVIPRPVIRQPVTPVEEEKPLYAVYALHSYPNPPQGLDGRQLLAWQKQVTNPRTFKPQSQPMGYIAFHVTGQMLAEYRAHQKNIETGQTNEPFKWFYPKGYYYQMASGNSNGTDVRVPQFMRFFRLEEERPVWITRSPAGSRTLTTMHGSIQSLSDLRSRGTWSTQLDGEKVTFGPIQYDGQTYWSEETRRSATTFLGNLIRGLENMFR